MTETKSNEKPEKNQIDKVLPGYSDDKLNDDEFLAVAKRVLRRNLEAYKELAK